MLWTKFSTMESTCEVWLRIYEAFLYLTWLHVKFLWAQTQFKTCVYEEHFVISQQSGKPILLLYEIYTWSLQHPHTESTLYGSTSSTIH